MNTSIWCQHITTSWSTVDGKNSDYRLNECEGPTKQQYGWLYVSEEEASLFVKVNLQQFLNGVTREVTDSLDR
jgi:hypothetical protein